MRRGFTLIELLVVITIIGILAGMALPNYLKAKDKAKEAEVRANLNVIQTALERYATDSRGAYPQYLIGGDEQSWIDNAAWLDRDPDERPPLDPLIHGGYQNEYPRNPFIDDGLTTTIAWTLGDPGLADFGQGDLRFGWAGLIIGNCLDDPRYLWESEGVISKLRYTFSPDATAGNENTGLNETIPFYMMGGVPNPEAIAEVLSSGWWEGQFFYRASGDYILRDEVSGGQGITNVWGLPFTSRSRFLMGVYGSNRTKGQDVIRLVDLNRNLLRQNTDGAIDNLFYAPNPYGGFQNVRFSPPEVMGGGDLTTMPVFPPINPQIPTEYLYGAPDGYQDGVIALAYPERDSKSGGSNF